VKTLYPDGTVTKSVYDSAGRVVWSVDRYLPGATDQGAPGTFTRGRWLPRRWWVPPLGREPS
jgi:hypothetical protein